MRIVGTAGHVDHGKSALVAALTGTNPDRFAEEQLRGMTLDLGFARLPLGGGLEAGIVDVPGHERFLHNMLAGASGMEVLLLVVAANEGIRTQTREHLEILRFLNVRTTIVVYTKADLVEEGELEAVRAATAAELRATIAAGAPSVAVSSVTGAGLEELKALIASALRALPARDPHAPAYLPVDRVFTLEGIGTVLTGTLAQGAIASGDVVHLEPSGKRARVRGIEVFGERRERVDGGSRVALWIPSIARDEIARGEAVVSHELAPGRAAGVRFTPLPQALPILRRRTPVRAYVGAAEILGTLLFDRVPQAAHEVPAMLHLREPAVLFPGLRFVVRRVSPKTLLGGGAVVGAAAGDESEAPDRSETAVLRALRERGLEGLDAAGVAREANLREEIVRETLRALVARSEAIALARPEAYADAAAARGLLARVQALLEEAHRAEPWSLGVTSIALARAVEVAEPLLVRLLAAFVEEGRVSNRAGYYAALDHQPELTAEQRGLFERIVPVDTASPLLPVPVADVVASVKTSRVNGAQKAFDTLLARGALVKVGDDLYRGSQIAQIRSRVERFLS
ncbi:MAG TPA: selenocysteine-specific translation elongation factor, partial [Verrucomicrobiae bacterium]|nr:selenocysteine-specific translation elongation factor [Verrucomicrobiae bacterium]